MPYGLGQFPKAFFADPRQSFGPNLEGISDM
jgi:hypothetical protein